MPTEEPSAVQQAEPSAVQQAEPGVSVIVVTYDARDHLEACLRSLAALEPVAGGVETIVVDNASTDGTREMLAASFPDVRLVANDHNVGFAPAVNQAAAIAEGSYLALLNNDATAHPAWLTEAVTVLRSNPQVGCVASLILREDGRTIDYAGGQMAFYGHGFAAGNKALHDGTTQAPRPTLFASGGAMVVRRETFLDAGGFDERYFAFFEDVDFGWRLWLYGFETWYVPASMVFHRHGETIKRFGSARERYLLERNALFTIFKNYSDASLLRTLPGSLGLALLRGLADPDSALPDYRITGGPVDLEPVGLSHHAGAHFAAVRDWTLELEGLWESRREVQARRTVSDRRLFRLFEEALLPNEPDGEFLAGFHAVVAGAELETYLQPRTRVLILTGDHLGPKMAGPAIRCWEMAKLLARDHQVTLGSLREPEISHPDFRVTQVSSGLVTDLLDSTDVVILQGFIMYFFPQIADADVAVLVDIYDPFHLEGLEIRRSAPPLERWATAHSDVEVLNDQLRRGDFFVCASEKQRDYWLGQLTAIERINPSTFDFDSSLRRLLDVAPFGLSSDPPQRSGAGPRDATPGIDADSFVLLWAGGIYSWFDPKTLIRAVAAAAEDVPAVRLMFMGTAHPNPDVPPMRATSEAYLLAEQLELLDRLVFFNRGWVPYEERANFLLDADVGVSTHFDHIETAYSFRTRILDYLWSGLPIITTRGDSLSELVDKERLGLTVNPEDVDDLTAAITRLATDRDFFDACRSNVERVALSMTWEQTLAPIVEFCNDPWHAPDRHLRRDEPAEVVAATTVDRESDVSRLARHYRNVGVGRIGFHARRFLYFSREEGLRRAIHRVRHYIDTKAES